MCVCVCSENTSEGSAVLRSFFTAAGASLRTLCLDGCHLGGSVLCTLGESCMGLEQLSVVGLAPKKRAEL